MPDGYLRFRDATVAPGGYETARNVDLDLRAGEVLAILGPNGRGKTTLIKALVGTLPLTTGTREVQGAIGYVPQGAGVGFDYRVREVVVMGRARHLGLFGSPRTLDYDAAETALDRVGMAHLADRTVTTLSGGERQLVMVARALAGECDLLILDEPASALDLKNQRHLFEILSTLAHDDGLAIAFSTHVPGHAFEAADQALLLHSADHRVLGAVGDVLSETALTDLYGTPVRVLAQAEPGAVLRAAVAAPVRP
ncbi:MAG: ABC transporter ATP-binding protein [Pseudomonadota bacterium]